MRWQTVAWLVGFACCVVAFAPQYSVDAKHTHRVSNNVFDELATAPQTERLSTLYVEVNWSAVHAVHHHTFELRNIASSAYDFTLTWSRSAGGSGHFYVFDLRSDASSSGDFTSTVSGDDLSVAYTASTWSDGSTSYYEFEAHKSATQSGTYTKQSTVNDDVSPAAMTNLPEGWYKVRGRRCVDSSRTECGAWSALTSSAVQITQSAPPPTALTLTLSGDNDLELTYTQSSWTGQTTHFYEFELLRSETSSGTYGEYEDDSDRASPLDFDDVHTGYYYRARGKRCASAGTSCGSWSSLSPQLNVPAKTTYTAPTLSTPTVSGATDDMTVGFSKSTVSALRRHHYVIELHGADSASGTFASDKTASATSSPVTFEGIDRSKVYKARGKRCETKSANACGPWSAFSSVWDGPSPPSALTLSLANENSLSASYTRSTTPTATTHYYQFKLVRSETASGTYADYGDIESTTLAASSTAYVSFDAVHTGYHYKAVGRRCRTSSADCGEWSSISGATALNVPVTDESAPSISTSKSTEGDDISVSFPDDSENGPSGQAVSPGVLPDASYYVVELRRATTSSGAFQYYDSSTAGSSDSPTDVTFTDVNPGWFYKARARACAGTARKLCGAWTVQPSALEVANPTGFPSLMAPTVKPTGNGALTAELTLPSSLYIYVVALESSKTGRTYTTISSKALTSIAETWEFAGLDPTAELFYVVALKACQKSSRTSCDTAVKAPSIRIPVITLSASDLTDVDLGTASEISVSAKYLPTDKDFKFVATKAGVGHRANAGVLKFDACAGSDSVDSDEQGITGRPASAGPEIFSPIGCNQGTDIVTVALKSGTTTYHFASKSITINSTVPTPTEVIANGRTPSNNTRSQGWATIRFNQLAGATSYVIRYAVERERDSRAFLSKASVDDFAEVVVTPTAEGELRLTNLTVHSLYKVQVRSVVNGEESNWSAATVVYPSSVSPKSHDHVADLILLGYLPSQHYEYTICDVSFPSNDWVLLIERAISKWEKAVVWEIDSPKGKVNIIRTTRQTRTSNACAESSSGNTTPWVGQMEVRMESGANWEMACGEATVASSCVNLQPHPVPKPGDMTKPELRSLDGDYSPYMVFNGNRDDDGELEAINCSPRVSSVSMFSCPELESQATHEAGHVFGIDHPLRGNTVMESIMYSIYDEREVTSPSVYDIAAMLSIYQNRSLPQSSGGNTQ